MNAELVKRLSPATDTIRRLLLRSGNRCAFPNCMEVIFNDRDELIGECCHIQAASPGGERYNPNQTNEERRAFENLLFLCHKHHVETNDDVIYTVEKLTSIKFEHEKQFSEKIITVNDKHVEQVETYFEHFAQKVDKALESLEEIKTKQDQILNIFYESAKVEFRRSKEYFGIPHKSNFIGRSDELLKLEIAFNKHNIFIIEGISGVGKTSLIATFLSKNNLLKTLWIDSEIVQSKEVFYNYFSRFLTQELDESSFEKALSSIDEPAIQNALLYILNTNDFCIVFDGLNDDNHELRELLPVFCAYSRKAKIMVSTKSTISTTSWSNPIYRMTLSGLDEAAFEELLDITSEQSEIKQYGSLLFQKLNGHPYLLKVALSTLSYKPIKNFLQELENSTLNAVDDFVKQKAIESLTGEQLYLLQCLSALIIPFRYEIGEHIIPNEFESSFSILTGKFLIEKFHEHFFVIPDFIRIYVIKKNPLPKTSIPYEAFISYLQSIKDNISFFEREAIIYHALNSQNTTVAKDEAQRLINTLMQQGDFFLANAIAATIQSDKNMSNWSWPYFIQGRIFRFQGKYEEALKKYESGFKVETNNDTANIFQFEQASMLTYLSNDQNDESFIKAQRIFQKLSKSNNLTLSTQARLSLVTLLQATDRHDEAEIKLELLVNEISTNTVEINVVASVWQVLAVAYKKNGKFEKAWAAYEKSIELYDVAVKKFGMNVIDGLYHLYESYAWSFADNNDYQKASEKFEICVELAMKYDLELKKEQAFFDYGYSLVMCGKFIDAVDILRNHYALIVEKDLIDESDMPFIHATLAFAFWYANEFVNAVELIGLYILSCDKRNLSSAISIFEKKSQVEEIDIYDWFKKRMYIFILPIGKSFEDLQSWIDLVVKIRPELTMSLSDFHYFKKD